MVRYWLFVAVVIGAGAVAVASIAPGTATNADNVTVVEKNQSWQAVDGVTAHNCPKEDCIAAPHS
jgi:hypothetical protein